MSSGPTPPGGAALPASKLRSRPVCNILSQQIVAPVLRNNWTVSAFRMAWPRPTDPNRNTWDDIVLMRAELDNLVRLVPRTLFFISAINSITNPTKDGSHTTYKVHPGVLYWLVSQPPVAESRNLCTLMNTNKCGATLRLILQPYQTAEKDIRQALFTGVKDNMSGCVRRLVEDSCERCYGADDREKEALVKFYVSKFGPRDLLEQAMSSLSEVRFRSEIYDIEAF